MRSYGLCGSDRRLPFRRSPVAGCRLLATACYFAGCRLPAPPPAPMGAVSPVAGRRLPQCRPRLLFRRLLFAGCPHCAKCPHLHAFGLQVAHYQWPAVCSFGLAGVGFTGGALGVRLPCMPLAAAHQPACAGHVPPANGGGGALAWLSAGCTLPTTWLAA